MDEERRSLAELYDEARAEGGTLTVYAGGDTPGQQDATVAAFNAAFPDVTLDMVVDYSKYHNVRIDRQLATGTLVADVPQAATPVWDLPNANVEEFVAFMADRAEVERWRQTLTLYLGEVHGDPTPGRLGLHPTKHAP
ncbi:hypothetical protein [Actinomadura harenae]|uniref:Uncharacterized protein n=1 Tax=Actinomadura harenae TaxID=2483351 RepID=A0A3M2LLL2_9ACTN|nr:hypothetical protein [Actinomadura harenae]RMI38324.1 hypothetical protein EBO15_33305 [Actinomadura harenae]